MQLRAAFDNATQIVGKGVVRARACDRCGTLEGVFITWSVPFDIGGIESVWNTNSLCTPCRLKRKRQHLRPQAEVDKMAVDTSKRRRQRVKIGDRVFVDVVEAAKFMGKAKQTIYHWIYDGRHGAQYVKDE